MKNLHSDSLVATRNNPDQKHLSIEQRKEAQSISLSQKAIDFIKTLREDENQGIYNQTDAIQQLLFELIRDENIGEENNRLYMRYLVDVIELTKSLLSE